MLSPVAAVALLGGALVLGVVAHELSHLLVLRVCGVGATLEVTPGRTTDGGLVAGMGGHLAQVRIERADDISPRALRIAALMPLAMTVPLVLVVAGVGPSPVGTGWAGGKLVVIAWLACSIPSPRDFSLAWYPDQALAAARDRQCRHSAGSSPD